MILDHDNFANGPILTSREQEILEHVAHGLSTKETAQQLDIAPRTVDRHVENIRLKLRAKNRSNMIACAIMEGLLDVSRDEVNPDEKGKRAC